MSIKETNFSLLNQQKLFSEAWWCNYCFCTGTACGTVGAPLFASETKELCIRSSCACTDPMKPVLCGGLSVFFCCTNQCTFPPKDGSPTCVCFNKTLAAGKSDVSNWKAPLFDWTANFSDQWWLYYFLCMGVGFSKPGANGRPPFFGQVGKELCIQSAVKCVAPIENGVFCSSLATSLCIWSQCECPPAENNPKFQFFGFPKKTEAKCCEYGKGAKEEAPPQQNI
jgi:hypothetical protein